MINMVLYYKKLTFSGIWGIILGLWCCHPPRILEKRLSVLISEIQISKGFSLQFPDTQVKFGCGCWPHRPVIWICLPHYPLPSPETEGGSIHQLQRYLLGDPPLRYESTMSEPNAKCPVFGCKESTQHSIVSQPQRTEKRHGFIHFLRQRPATVSKNCSCLLTTSRLTVSPTSANTRQE